MGAPRFGISRLLVLPVLLLAGLLAVVAASPAASVSAEKAKTFHLTAAVKKDVEQRIGETVTLAFKKKSGKRVGNAQLTCAFGGTENCGVGKNGGVTIKHVGRNLATIVEYHFDPATGKPVGFGHGTLITQTTPNKVVGSITLKNQRKKGQTNTFTKGDRFPAIVKKKQ